MKTEEVKKELFCTIRNLYVQLDELEKLVKCKDEGSTSTAQINVGASLNWLESLIDENKIFGDDGSIYCLALGFSEVVIGKAPSEDMIIDTMKLVTLIANKADKWFNNKGDLRWLVNII